MRTTLDIDADILGVAKEMAAKQGTSTGKVLSELARKGLKPKKAPKFRNGFELLEHPPGTPVITMEFVNRLRDEE